MAKPPETATLVYRRDLTDTLAIFRFTLENGIPDYLPGQFITLGLPDPEAEVPDGGSPKVVWRAYSIASPPSRKEFMELYIRRPMSPVPGKFTSALWELPIGGTLPHRKVTGPFTIEDTRPDGSPDDRTLLLVGGGTGVAPYVAYVLELQRRGVAREAVVVHGASYVVELGYDELLRGIENETRDAGPDAFRLRYVPSISRPREEPNAGWSGEIGRAETLLQPPEGGGRSRIEEILDRDLVPGNFFVHVCGYDGTCKASQAVLEPRDFRGFRQKRGDGSFDLKIESYG